MKHELTHCHLRFAQTEGYHPIPEPARNYVMEQAVEPFALDEPRRPARDNAAPAEALGRSPAAKFRRIRRPAEPQAEQHQRDAAHGVSANPFREEPEPSIVAAVQRFGLVGLLAGALGAGCVRVLKNLFR
jgi:hypothetical protein